MSKLLKDDEYLESTESNKDLKYYESKKGVVIDFFEYKNIKNSFTVTEKSNRTFIKTDEVSSRDFITKKEENIMTMLNEYLLQKGCRDITQKIIPKWKTDFEKDVTLVSAKYKAKNKKDIDKLRLDIFNKFPLALGEESILLNISKG